MNETEEIVEAGSEWDTAFDDGAEPTPAPETGANQPEPENQEPAPDGAEPNGAEAAGGQEPEPEPEEQRYTLKTPEGTRQVGIEELIDLGRKGLDYDRVKQELISLRQKRDSMEGAHEQFLKEMADQDGVSVEDFIDSVRAATLSRRDNIDRDRALERVRYERKIKELEAQAAAGQKTQEQIQAEEKTKRGFAEFRKAYPDIKSEDIPNAVWQRVKDGMSLIDAYKIQEADRLEKELSQLKAEKASAEQAQKNAVRSMGSKSTSGGNSHVDLWEKYLS
jgi:hypothetical protein